MFKKPFITQKDKEKQYFTKSAFSTILYNYLKNELNVENPNSIFESIDINKESEKILHKINKTIDKTNHLKKLRHDLVSGKFDKYIFDTFTMTPEFKAVIKEENRMLFQRILAKSNNIKVLKFWLSNGLCIPNDAIQIALAFDCSIDTFKLFNEEGFFEKIDNSGRIDILKYANEIKLSKREKKNEIIEYLASEFFSKVELKI